MKKTFNLTITATHPVIKNHLVHGQTLLPGLAYIDMLYQLAQIKGLDYREHCLKRLSISNPLIVGENRSVKLKISFDKPSTYWKIIVEGTEIDNQGNPLQEKLYITGEMHKEAMLLEEQINIEAMKQAASQRVDIETAYSEAGKRGLVHQGMMKAKGTIYLTDPGCLIEVNVDNAYHDEAKRFLFHPTLIDGPAMASGVLEGNSNAANNEDLYLPIYYESFSCAEPFHTQLYARVSLSSLRMVNDIQTMDMAFFNTEGKHVAQLKGITGKRVRFKGQINPDFKKETAGLSPVQESFVVSAAPSHHHRENTKVMNTATAHRESLLRKIFSKRLNRADLQIDLETGFFELGLESSQLLAVVKDIESAFDLSLSPTLLFENSNLRELISYLEKKGEEEGVFQHLKAKEEHKDKSVPPHESLPSESNTYEFYEHEAFLQDHLVYNQPALMGVTHPCLVLETYIQNNPEAYPVELKNVQFLGGPVTLKKTERVHVQVQFEGDKSRTSFKTVHYIKDPGHTRPCCKGEYIGPANVLPEAIDIEAMLSRSKPMDRDEVDGWYRNLEAFTIGPTLQTIDSVYAYDMSTFIIKVCLSGKLRKGNVSHFVFDPLLLNSCYFLKYDRDAKSDNIFIPLMIEHLTVFRAMTETAYIVKTIRCQKTDFVSYDAMVLTGKGDIIAEIVNASVKEVLNPSLLSNASFHATSPQPAFATSNKNQERNPQAMDIAIVGLAGRYPQSYDVNVLWKNLRDGKDCIAEIPDDRWDWREYYTEDRTKPGHAYSKWGGFIEDVDRFDPLFFNIPPRAAEIIDPQERLFLEHCWMALEDAGYTREKLQNTANALLPGQVGVYAGAMHQEYPLYAAESSIRGQRFGLGGGISSIATRVSYFFNFHGPSMAIDTMCSSSLTAISMACQALTEKSIDAALAGGVNLTIHPNKYLMLSQGQFISSKGHCESFGEGGDGYIPGEGVGVLFLKRLADAQRDKDHIYAVIKGAAINHGGRASGYTVPNPQAQSMVIAMALKESKIDPRTISYIEAHGTGTSLGDPIEIAALTKTFREYTKDKQFCAIGSVKSNIGHCESAAGIAGLTKVLLQLKYRQLVPSLHSKVLNPNIDFSNTPFVVQQELAEWKRPMVEINGETRECPRIAGISSFGAGGSNAHIVVEEYISGDQEVPHIPITPQNPAIIVLSAKNEDRLKEQARQLVAVMKEQQFSDNNLSDMAYTLQVGREAMEERLAVIVGSLNELEEKLKSFVEGRDNIDNLYRGQVKRDKETLAVFVADEELQEAVDKWIQRRKYAKLLDFWVKGLIFDWNKLYGDIKPRRISLPTYPFAGERYWVPVAKGRKTEERRQKTQDRGETRDPMLHHNPPNSSEQKEAARHSQLIAAAGSEFSNIIDKPRSISLPSLSDDQNLAGAPSAQTQDLAASSSTEISTSQPRTDDESKPVTYLQEAVSVEELVEKLATSLGEALYMKRSDIDADKQLVDMGLDSIVGVEWIRAINKQYGTTIQATKVYDYPTIREFAGFLKKELSKQGGELNQTPLKSTLTVSLEDMLQKVQQGTLDIDAADQLLHQIHFSGETKRTARVGTP